MRLAVIPARGGSRRIPRKNIREFCGKPMIGWSIAAAIESGCFGRIVVSTDDEQIGAVARELGAEVPFLRPASLSDDRIPTQPVVAHAINALSQEGLHFGEVCCLYATAPFVSSADLRRCLERLLRGDCTYVFPVTTFAFAIQRGLRLKTDGHVEMLQPENFLTRSQDLEEAWHDAGQFYWATSAQWCDEAPIFAPSAVGIPVERHRVQDIDTPEDWRMAELMFQAMRQK